jgi:hypothetical protein
MVGKTIIGIRLETGHVRETSVRENADHQVGEKTAAAFGRPRP